VEHAADCGQMTGLDVTRLGKGCDHRSNGQSVLGFASGDAKIYRDVSSGDSRTGNLWSLRWVQDGTPICILLLSLLLTVVLGHLFMTGTLTLLEEWVKQDVQRGAPAGVAAIHSGNLPLSLSFQRIPPRQRLVLWRD